MKLGLLADIHEATENLTCALEGLARLGVDRIVHLGDVATTGKFLDETCRLLAEAGVIGVWGNHDFGVCHEPAPDVRARHTPATLGYMTSLTPRLELAGCHFAHIEPWLNPEDLADLWYFDGPPESPERLTQIFAASPCRWLFMGHYHRWLLATPHGLLPWEGESAVRLNDGRYFVVVGALCEGWYATFDTTSGEFCPHSIAPRRDAGG